MARWPPRRSGVGYLGAAGRPGELLEKDRQGLIGGVPFRGIEFYLPLLHSDAASLLDYLPRSAVIALDRRRRDFADTWSELEEQAIDLPSLGGRRSRPAA